jgi:hypothetical protein
LLPEFPGAEINSFDAEDREFDMVKLLDIVKDEREAIEVQN